MWVCVRVCVYVSVYVCERARVCVLWGDVYVYVCVCMAGLFGAFNSSGYTRCVVVLLALPCKVRNETWYKRCCFAWPRESLHTEVRMYRHAAHLHNHTWTHMTHTHTRTHT